MFLRRWWMFSAGYNPYRGRLGGKPVVVRCKHKDDGASTCACSRVASAALRRAADPHRSALRAQRRLRCVRRTSKEVNDGPSDGSGRRHGDVRRAAHRLDAVGGEGRAHRRPVIWGPGAVSGRAPASPPQARVRRGAEPCHRISVGEPPAGAARGARRRACPPESGPHRRQRHAECAGRQRRDEATGVIFQPIFAVDPQFLATIVRLTLEYRAPSVSHLRPPLVPTVR